MITIKSKEPNIKIEYPPDNRKFDRSMITPELEQFFRHVIKVAPDPAHLDDAIETLETLTDTELSLICESGMGNLRDKLISDLEEVEIRFGMDTRYWQNSTTIPQIDCDWLIELLGEGKV